MVKYFFLSALTILVTGVTYLYIHLGASKPVEISIANSGPFNMLYVEHLGAYHNINSDIQKVENWAREQNLLCARTFGEFLDDPSAVDQDRLRSRVGCLMSAPVTNPPEDFSFEERRERKFVIGTFNGSPSIGPFKVYPKISEFMEKERISSKEPVIEIYTINGTAVETQYLFPID